MARRRGIGQAIIFPEISSYFYVSSIKPDSVDIGVLEPGKSRYMTLPYREANKIFLQHPEIEIIPFRTRERKNTVTFSLNAPADIYFERAERVLRDFSAAAFFKEDGTLVNYGQRYMWTGWDYKPAR